MSFMAVRLVEIKVDEFVVIKFTRRQFQHNGFVTLAAESVSTQEVI